MDEKKKVEFEEHQHIEHEDEISPELELLLHTDPSHGLTSSEVQERQAKFGMNELPEKKTNPFLKFFGYFTGPISYLIEISCIIAAVVGDWIDFGIILALLIINAVIGYIEEAKAESALDALRQTLALKTRSYRDNELTEVDVKELVPGDIIVLRIGDIVPADARPLGLGVNGEESEAELMIDQSGLTGESLLVAKKKGSTVYSSSIIKQGQQLAIVTKTGTNTFIGRAANLIAITAEEGHFQKIIGKIGNVLIWSTVILVLIVFIYQMVHFRGTPQGNWKIVLENCLVLTVAAIPVGLPTVMSVTMAVGAKQLAAKQVIVKRLTAVEELASVSVLCSDKTGTLTLNELTFDKPWLTNGYSEQDILLYSYLAAEPGANDPIESAVRRAAEGQLDILKNRANAREIPGYKVTKFSPFNPVTKMTQATILDLATNESFHVAKGAPQVITSLVGGDDEAVHAVNSLARRGLRALGVAKSVVGSTEKFELVGMISLLDPPRPDSLSTIAECNALGVDVKMITGDQLIIAKEVAARLGMGRVILDANHLVDPNKSEDEVTEHCVRADGFAQVIPEHKYRVVELLQNKGLLVGMTGDGVNDAPALKKADVGIAVEGCTDAARSAADIVLLAPGLSTITDGIVTSRAIFQRLRSYALYRITSTIHFLLFMFIVTLVEDWTMPAVLLIMICVLNDAATLVISVDNTEISEKPDKWRIGQLLTLSFVLAALLAALSFAHFYVARDVFHVTDNELHSIMYLHISSGNFILWYIIDLLISYIAPHFVIFSTRVPGYWFKNMPNWIFTVCIIGTQVIALFFSVYGVFGEHEGVAPCGYPWGLSVLGISLVYFMILDVVKVQIFRYWSFEMTAKMVPTKTRRTKLASRKQLEKKGQQLETSWKKIEDSVAASSIAVAFQNYAQRAN
ncbi:plasma-membrane proton-efflux P-type ATPase [Gilbertella persicaria]|uniref:plasma-membrane proton-efflux P-type ATPase n=1 Tax=Gilbertella persicaria TaxID=101096 RepID=UPI00221F52AD|nr:plasma-membrane proton-efflux P-type ATPase [Gilbertella persicaria]KAI8087638.1 plasma-membrane proton-efflux P-type ATPase [Gilbertella persicaria]